VGNLNLKEFEFFRCAKLIALDNHQQLLIILTPHRIPGAS
jgi:hypothetical protein